MREHLANQTVLVMPQIMDAYALHRKTFCQMRAHGFNHLAPPSTGVEDSPWVVRLHPGTWWGDYRNGVAVCQQRLFLAIDKAFIGWHHTVEVFDQGFQMVDVMRAGCQQRILRDHPAA